MLFVPIAVISVVGAVLRGRILDRENAHQNISSLILGAAIGVLSIGLLILIVVTKATVQDYHPGIRTLLFFLIYLGMIWGWYHLILAAIAGALNGWLLYRCRALMGRVFASRS